MIKQVFSNLASDAAISAFPCVPGEKIAKGDLLILLEAMKTMYSVCSDVDGFFLNYAPNLAIYDIIAPGQRICDIEVKNGNPD